MPRAITITRPAFTNADTPDATACNAVWISGAIVPDADGASEGVIRLAGDLAGTAAAPALAVSGVTAAAYGGSGANIPSITVDAKGRVTVAANRALTPSDIGAQPAGSLAFPNRLINGNFDVWQRGTTTTTMTSGSRTFLADRWAVKPAGANMSAEQSATVPNFRSRYSLLLTGAASVTTVDVAQRIEQQTVATALGTTVVFSAQVRNDTGAAFTPTLIVRTPGSADNWAAPTDRLTQVLGSCADAAWTQVSYSFDVTALTNYANGLEVCLQIPSGSLVSGKTVKLAQMDLRQGSTVGTFDVVPYALELARCFYFYEQLDGWANGDMIQVCSTRNGSAADMAFPYAYKRIDPTVAVSSNAHFGILDTGGIVQNLSTLSITGSRRRASRISISSASMPAAGGGVMFCTQSTSAKITVDAELT